MLQLSMVLLPSPSMITMLATISTDSQYSISVHKTLTTPITDHHVTDWEVFKLLDKLRPTATGLDLIPAWFLRLAAPVLCKPLSRLFSVSVSTGIVPSQWKQAYIRPVPKVRGHYLVKNIFLLLRSVELMHGSSSEVPCLHDFFLNRHLYVANVMQINYYYYY